MAFQIYRLTFSDPLQFYEQMGDPISSTGGAPVPAMRGALRHSVSLATFDEGLETVASRLKLRRQWRSMVNNTPMKLQGVYLGWTTDPENNGWYMPDQGQLVDLEGATGLSTGVFKVENFVWIVAGRPRTHRRAMWVYLKDLRAGQWARDFRRLIYGTDFSTLSALALTYFPPGVFDLLTTGGQATLPAALPVGADGGEAYVVKGLIDLARVSFEQEKAAINQGQVVAYDRRGELSASTSGPGASWEEFYGPDYPYFWQAGGPRDAPVIENGRCRVRYDPTGTPGFCIDQWNGQWEEQGKIIVGRIVGANPFMDTLLSASLAEYSETRAVIQCVMHASSDAQSREEIVITLQRGWSGPRIEVYTSPTAAGVLVDAYLQFATAVNDTDDSAIKVDTSEAGVGSIVATAQGTGHTGKFPTAGIGAATFTGENWIAMGRWGAAYGVVLGVLAATVSPNTTQSQAYGVGVFRNALQLVGTGKAGYLSTHLAFPPQKSEQALEAESMTLASGTTSVADAAASNGKAAQAKRKVEGLHVSKAAWPNGYAGVYRIFARVKATSGTLKLRAKTSATTGSVAEVAASATPTYTWIDLGLISTAGAGTLEIFAWQSVEVNFQVDRIEAFLAEDRVAASPGYQGARDLGQSILYDSRAIPTIVSRST